MFAFCCVRGIGNMKTTTIPKQRIKNVFNGTLRQVRTGKQPNISALMRREGYAETSVRAQKVTHTKTWEHLKALYLKDELALNTFNQLASETNDDKDNRLKASVEIMKLNDRYPALKSKVVGLFQNLD